MSSEFLPMRTFFRNKQTGEMSSDFVSLLPSHLTVDSTYTTSRFYRDDRTLFQEVEIAPLRDVWTEEDRAVFETRASWDSDPEDLFARVYDTLKGLIWQQWLHTPYHAVLHSSGLDSRVLSWIIRELYEEWGPEWLGMVVFLCNDRESPNFLKIMEFEGWPKDTYHVVRNGKPADRYYEHDLLDFEHAWKRLNGLSGLPVNLFWYPIAWAQREGYLPLDGEGPIQTWTGYWGNTVLDGASAGGGKGIQANAIRFYRSALCTRPIKGDIVVRPYTHRRLATAVCANKLRLGESFRPRFVEWISPTLASFKNHNAEGDRFRRVAPDIRQRCQDDYDASWYGQHVALGVKLPAELEFHGGWSRWCSASLCEWLRNHGYTLEIA